MAKDKVGKPRLGLVYYTALEAIARARENGIDKYGARDDWRSGTVSREDYYDAAIRHLQKAKSAELDENSQFSLKDEDSGELHKAHAMVCIMFLIEDKVNPMEGHQLTICNEERHIEE